MNKNTFDIDETNKPFNSIVHEQKEQKSRVGNYITLSSDTKKRQKTTNEERPKLQSNNSLRCYHTHMSMFTPYKPLAFLSERRGTL